MMMPMPFPPPPPRRRSIVHTLLTVFLALALIVSLAINGLVLLAGMLAGGSGPLETTVQAGSSDKVVVIPIEGVIVEETATQVREWAKSVANDSNVKGIVLAVNTPGGVLTPSDEIHQIIADLKAQRNIPVVVSMGSMATSGGYYVSCGADYIFAQPTTLTANIGVRMDRFNLSGLVQKWGVSETTLTAPPKGFKNAGSMFQPESASDTAYLQALIDSGFNRFIKVVKDGRKGKLSFPDSEIFNGAAFTADQALKAGLIDKIGYEADACDWIVKQASLDKPTITRFRKRVSLLGAFSADSDSSAHLDGVNVTVHVDRKALDDMNSPRVMCIYRGE